MELIIWDFVQIHINGKAVIKGCYSNKREYKSGDHKVHAKRKGKATISCVVKRTYGHWVKGDVHKWVITVK